MAASRALGAGGETGRVRVCVSKDVCVCAHECVCVFVRVKMSKFTVFSTIQMLMLGLYFNWLAIKYRRIICDSELIHDFQKSIFFHPFVSGLPLCLHYYNQLTAIIIILFQI